MYAKTQVWLAGMGLPVLVVAALLLVSAAAGPARAEDTPAVVVPAVVVPAVVVPAVVVPASDITVPAGDGPVHSGLALLELLQREGVMPVTSVAEEREYLDELLRLSRIPALLLDTPELVAVPGQWLISMVGTAEHPLALLRLTGLDRVFPAEQAALQQAIAEKRYNGLIVDLRSVDGQHGAVVEAMTTLLGDGGLPVVVLIDAQTAGMAESLARQLQERGAFLMGEASRGIPGVSRVVTFRDGLYVRLPQRPAAGASPVSVMPVLPNQDLSALPLGEDGDPWVTHAGDVLVAITVFRRPHD